MTVSEQALADALARAEIHDLLMAYSRGADRADAELLASIFTPDAEVVTGAFNGPASEFAPMICGFIRDNMDCCFHSVANEWIDVRGDEAVGEHYVIAHIVTGGREITTGGRYVDRYQKRDGKWLIRTRSFVNDWTTAADATLEREGFYASLPSWGTRDKTDPVYAAWGQK